jgi:nitroreductase
MALTSANIQAGFFLIAARAHGLDCGPMAGFDAEPIERVFFDVPSWRFGWVVLLGEGDPEALYPRAARLNFETACKVV